MFWTVFGSRWCLWYVLLNSLLFVFNMLFLIFLLLLIVFWSLYVFVCLLKFCMSRWSGVGAGCARLDWPLGWRAGWAGLLGLLVGDWLASWLDRLGDWLSELADWVAGCARMDLLQGWLALFIIIIICIRKGFPLLPNTNDGTVFGGWPGAQA